MNIIVLTRTQIVFDALHFCLKKIADVAEIALVRGIGEAFVTLSHTKFDACLVDFDLPGAGIALPDFHAYWPAMRVVGLGRAGLDGQATHETRFENLDRHASATEIAELLTARRPPNVMTPPRPTETAEPRTQLSLREHQIAKLLVEGLSNKTIARELSIRPNTVKNHVHNILEKLDVSSRAQIAGRLGLLTPKRV